MRLTMQAAVCALVLLAPLTAQEKVEAFSYKPPVTEKKLFDDTLTMLDRERSEYATNLATYAANHVIEKKADDESLETARRILGLSLHLDQRNRQALVVNFQLKKGVLPKIKEENYNPRTFSRLLLTRAKILGKSERESEKLLARCFVELSAMIDPRNEDAVFAFEIQRIESGEIDWRLVTEATKDKPSLAPGEE